MEYHAERRVSWEFLFVAFVLTAALMLGMFYMGVALNDQKLSNLDQTLEQFAVERDAQDLSRRIANNLPQNNCKALNVATRRTIEDIRQLRDSMSTYEDTRKLENPEYERLKKQYTHLLLEYWLTAQDVEDQCGSDIVKVLYLYHNREQCPRCADQGTILTKYRRQYDTQLLVFPLDVALDMKPINLIIDSYNVDTYPALIIDGAHYEGFKSNDELGTILQHHMQVNQTTAGNTT